MSTLSNNETSIAVGRALSLRYYGDLVLRREAAEIDEITPEVRELAEEMYVAMYADDGIGLAGPQVGCSLRLITLATNQTAEQLPPNASPGERLLWAKMPLALVNPRILSVSEKSETVEEGCLSLPGIYGPVERPVSVLLHAALLSGETLNIECGGMLGRCLQHEIDHLNGVLFIDRLAPEDAEAVEQKLYVLKKETRRSLKRRRK